MTQNDKEIEVLEKKFIDKYLITTVMKYFSKKPNKNWILTWRIMKQYRIEAKRLNIQSSPLEFMRMTPYNSKVQAYFLAQWAASHAIPNDQSEYFDAIHKKAWK